MGIGARMAWRPTPVPKGMVEREAEVRKRDGEVNVGEKMEVVEMEGGEGEYDGNAVPLTKVLSRAV